MNPDVDTDPTKDIRPELVRGCYVLIAAGIGAAGLIFAALIQTGGFQLTASRAPTLPVAVLASTSTPQPTYTPYPTFTPFPIPAVVAATSTRSPTQSPIGSDVLLGTWEYQKPRPPMPNPAGQGQVIVAHGDIDNSGTCHLKVFGTGESVQGLGDGTFQLWLVSGTPEYIQTAIANHQSGAAAHAGGSCPRLP